MVRSFLDGRFENTAFCLLAPDGKERLSRSSRAPNMALSERRGPPRGAAGLENEFGIAAMDKVAKNYTTNGDPKKPEPQDFHSFRQALNVASGHQRLLLFISMPEDKQGTIKPNISQVLGDPDIVGKFHTDFYSNTSDQQWTEVIEGEKSKAGIFIIHADTFGQNGEVIQQLPADAKPAEIKSALLEANQKFATMEQRKVYGSHVAAGRRQGAYFEGGVEYGEDRDGDGKIDHRGGGGGRRPSSTEDSKPSVRPTEP